MTAVHVIGEIYGEMLVAIEIIMISGVVYYNRVMDIMSCTPSSACKVSVVS